MQLTFPMMRPRYLLVLISACLCVAGFSKPKDLYFVPIGNAPVSDIHGLVTHYRKKFGIDIHVLPAIAVPRRDYDQVRKQLIAQTVIQTMLRSYPDYANDGSSVLIGITQQDMYPRDTSWKFCFGWRIPAIRSAVVSTARMNLQYPGEPLAEATVDKRLRKTVTKDIGILYYGMSPNANPRSVLYSKILGIQDLDRVTEDFTPSRQRADFSAAEDFIPNRRSVKFPAFVIVGIVAGLLSALILRLLARMGGSDPSYQHVYDAGKSLPDPLEEHYAAAWRDRRRRFIVFKTVQFSFFPLLLASWLISRMLHIVSAWPALYGMASWFAAYLAAGIWLNRFRCPRCGKFYYWRWELKGYTERQNRWRDCHWCGIHQDQMPSMPTGSPVS